MLKADIMYVVCVCVTSTRFCNEANTLAAVVAPFGVEK